MDRRLSSIARIIVAAGVGTAGLLLAQAAVADPPRKGCGSGVEPWGCRFRDGRARLRVPISIHTLLADPAKFDGYEVSVSGVLSLATEEERWLFVDEDSFKYGLTANALWLEPSAEFNQEARGKSGAYFDAVGVFHKGPCYVRLRAAASGCLNISQLTISPPTAEERDKLKAPDEPPPGTNPPRSP
ncbi:MAG: hypothetical protein U1E65_15980 [Myxococcota bacterium]